MLYPPHLTKQFSKSGETQLLDYRVPLLDSWPDREVEQRPLSVIDTVELSLAYQCTISQQDIVQYIHINRWGQVGGMEHHSVLPGSAPCSSRASCRERRRRPRVGWKGKCRC